MAEAARLELAGPDGKPLFGLTIAVKDNIDVAGLPTTAACPAFAYTPSRSAHVVERLVSCWRHCCRQDQSGPVRDGTRGCGSALRRAAQCVERRSSSGSAVAVAAGIVDASLGTDTAGSGRIPAGMNGIVGLKPSLGLLSSSGMVPACRTLDTISVFARHVDLARRVAGGGRL